MREYEANETIYIDVREIRAECKDYCKGIRSSTQLLARKNLTEYVYGQIVDDELVITEKYSKKLGSIFVKKTDLQELFYTLATKTEPEVLLPVAPPILEDADLVFFKDEDGKEYHVTMRGERTKEGIFFQVKEVMNAFQMEHLQKNIQKPHTGYKSNEHYIWFDLSKEYNVLIQQKEIFLTYSGLRKVIETSRSGVGYKFKQWIDDVVFASVWGTQEQKVAVAARVLNADADHLKAIMSKCPTTISCLYLIDIGIKDDSKRVFKYGLTKDIKRRFNEHMKTYGDNIKLDTFVFIPLLELSKAETTFKHSVSRYSYKRGDEEELISVCDESYINIKTIFRTISENHTGNLTTQIAFFEHEVKDLKHAHEIELMKIRHESEIKDHKLEIKDGQIEMLMLRLSIK